MNTTTEAEAIRLANEHPAVTLLREVEWAGGTVDGCRCCPSCGADRYPHARGGLDAPPVHAAGCRLAALLAGANTTPPPDRVRCPVCDAGPFSAGAGIMTCGAGHTFDTGAAR